MVSSNDLLSVYVFIQKLNFTWWCRSIDDNEKLLMESNNKDYAIYNEQTVPEPYIAYKAGETGGCFGNGAGKINWNKVIKQKQGGKKA